jgi:NAD(P)-dependent dehydrogenase (short-subunit alcohol dehydrogenase family)
MIDASAFAGKLALVTGAGDGIGAMLARGFAGWGMRVCVQDIRADAAAAVADEIGNGAFPLVFDVSDVDTTIAAAATLRAAGEALSLLWCNAGAGVGSSLLTGKQSTIEWGFSVNVLGVIWTTQAFAPLMTQGDAPRHVGFTASSASLRSPRQPMPLYPVTKHGTFAVAEALAGELAERDIASSILFPGLLNTNIWDGARARPNRFGGPRRADSAISARWDAAKDPALMWPHIERTVLSGGGYLACETEGGLASAIQDRSATLSNAITEI